MHGRKTRTVNVCTTSNTVLQEYYPLAMGETDSVSNMSARFFRHRNVRVWAILMVKRLSTAKKKDNSLSESLGRPVQVSIDGAGCSLGRFDS